MVGLAPLCSVEIRSRCQALRGRNRESLDRNAHHVSAGDSIHPRKSVGKKLSCHSEKMPVRVTPESAANAGLFSLADRGAFIIR